MPSKTASCTAVRFVAHSGDMIATFLQKNWFVIGILVALVLGVVFSGFGSSLNEGSWATTVLVVLLFLILGFTLPSETITTGLKNLRLHLFVQAFIFIVTPLYFLVTSFLFRDAMDGYLVIGLFALACLPTTISSCVVFTQVSEGNVVASMFNAAVANVMGIVLSPLILSFLLQGAGRALPPEEAIRIFQSLALKMLLPIAAGQVVRVFLKRIATEHRKKFGTASNVFILLIVFFAIARTAQDPAFIGSLREMILPFLFLAVSHVLLLALAYGGARGLRLPGPDVITTLYVAPQKTLALGVPLLSTYFAADPIVLGVAVLPLLFYHPWQLLVAGVIRSLPLMNRLKEEV
jgi:solute carrier family 10 (sodium/bile acid cotransporter), member 7